jgi:hypothetical protein
MIKDAAADGGRPVIVVAENWVEQLKVRVPR